MNKTLQIRLVFLAALIVAGIFIRFVNLGTHFSHVDDLGVAKTILEYKQSQPPQKASALEKLGFYWVQFTAVPRHWTYAPGQFFLTTLALRPGLSYRDTLFWGRMPSFVFAILSLLMWIWFYKKYDGLKTPAVSVGLALLVFSWQNIIYANQMQSYAIGVFSSTALLVLLWAQLQPGNFSLKNRLIGALIAAALSFTQYQVLFLIPAYFFTIFANDWLHAPTKRRAILNTLVPALVFFAIIYPMYLAFLKRQSHTSGVIWNVGPNNEFKLIWDAGANIFSNLAKAAVFFAKNTYIVYGSMIAFMPEKGMIFEILRCILFLIFLAGIASIALSRIWQKRALGIFFLGIAAAWIYLILKGHLAYSPTRHSLILLPYFAYLTAEGWIEILKLCHRTKSLPWLRFATIPLLLSIMAPFAVAFPARVAERRDLFDEDKIAAVLDRFQADILWGVNFTQHPSLMPKVLKNHSFFEQEEFRGAYIPRGYPPFNVIGIISHRDRLNPSAFEMMRLRTQIWCRMRGMACSNQIAPASDYKLVYREEIESKVEVDPSQRTRNGTNSFFFYVLQRR